MSRSGRMKKNMVLENESFLSMYVCFMFICSFFSLFLKCKVKCMYLTSDSKCNYSFDIKIFYFRHSSLITETVTLSMSKA